MNGGPFKIAAAGLGTALLASIVAGVSHFRTESNLLARSEPLPIYSATIAIAMAEEPAAPPVEVAPMAIPAPAISPAAVEPPQVAALPPILPPPAMSAVETAPEPRVQSSAPPAMMVRDIRRKKEFIELPPPPEFLDEPDPKEQLVSTPLPQRTLEASDDRRLADEIAALRRELERLTKEQRQQLEVDRVRDGRFAFEYSTDQRLRELQSSIDELRSREADRRIAMLQTEPQAPVLERPVPPAGPGAAIPPGEPVASHPRVTMTPSAKEGQFDFDFEAAELSAVLAEVGRAGGLNIAVGADVRGEFTAHWKGLTPLAALEAIRLSRGLISEKHDSFVVISTAVEAQGREASRKTIVQLFRPLYISGRDLLPLVQPLLTPDVGRVAVTLPRTAEETQLIPGGGDSLAQPDALIVVDYPETIELVTRTIAEIDVPAPHVELEATILDVQLSGRVKDGVGALLAAGEFSNRPGFATLDDPEQLPCDSCCQTCDLSCADLVAKLKLWTDVRLVSNARLLVLNKQPAELIVGSETLSLTPSGPRVPSAAIDNTMRLFVRPFVAADHLVRMEVSPEALTSRMQPMNTRRDSFAGVGTNVVIPNCGSLVIAGLNVDQQVSPSALFDSFGRLRRRRRDPADRAARRELVIMITPRIMPAIPPTE